jgi:hypothetical protein
MLVGDPPLLTLNLTHKITGLRKSDTGLRNWETGVLSGITGIQRRDMGV